MTSWSKLIGFFILLAVLIVAGVFWLKSHFTQHDFSSDETSKQFIIGNDVLQIPLNMIRFAVQREQTVLNQVDLAMYWIDGSGFVEANRRVFLTPEGAKDLIFISIGNRTLDFDMSDRLQPIYSKLLSGPRQSGPAGLILQSFQPGSGYDGEELAVATEGETIWVARCQKEGTMDSPICMRDLFAGAGLSLRYRFSRSLLPFWREVEAMVQTKRSQIVVTGK